MDVGKESQVPAYFLDWAFVRPMTLWRAVALPFTYPVDPTTMALTCSVRDPFFTVSVCAPDVAPVSPVTEMETPPCAALEEKWTPWLVAALIEFWYSVWALGGLAAPATDGAVAKATKPASAAAPMAAAAVRRTGIWRRGRMTITLLVRGPRRAMRQLDRWGRRHLPTPDAPAGFGVPPAQVTRRLWARS